MRTNYYSRFALCVVVSCFAILSGCTKKPAEAMHVKVTMKKYQIEPAEIRLKQGVPAVLEVSTLDVQHGFGVPVMGIEEPIQPGKPAEITIDTSKKGEYPVECTIICGPHHDDMKAKIVIE